MKSKILIVDDQQSIISFLQTALSHLGHVILPAPDGYKALEIAHTEMPDLVLLDYMMPGIDGLEVMQKLHNQFPGLCVIMMTADTSASTAVAAMQKGAFDYITKPFNVEQLLLAVERGLEVSTNSRELLLLKKNKTNLIDFSSDVVNLPSFQKIIEEFGVLSGKSRILVEGESGVGKRHLARKLHGKSPAPFLAMNCLAIAQDQHFPELCGVEVSTDGKHEIVPGLVELANSGTLFIEELSELSKEAQNSLYDLLCSGKFKRSGGHNDIFANFNLIAGTSTNLQAIVEDGRFSEKLYHLLKQETLFIPPLRSRVDDILVLAKAYLKHFDIVYHKRILGFTKNAAKAMEKYSWPFNSKELKSSIERAVLLHDVDLLDTVHLGLTPRGRTVEDSLIAEIVSALKTPMDQEPVDLESLISDLEYLLLAKAMDSSCGNKSKAARFLGLNRDKIRYRLKAMAKGQK